MQFVHVSIQGKTVAVICGKASIANNTISVSIIPEHRELAMQVVLLVPGSMFTNGILTIPSVNVNYLSNSDSYKEPSIKITKE